MSDLTELELLADGGAVTVTVAGESIEVRPFKVRQLPAVMQAGQPFFTAARTGTLDVMGLLGEHPAAVVDCTAVALGRPREWVEELDVDDLVRLAGAVVRVNLDFFVRRVLPAIDLESARLARQAGPTPSSASSPTGTATQTA